METKSTEKHHHKQDTNKESTPTIHALPATCTSLLCAGSWVASLSSLTRAPAAAKGSPDDTLWSALEQHSALNEYMTQRNETAIDAAIRSLSTKDESIMARAAKAVDKIWTCCIG